MHPDAFLHTAAVGAEDSAVLRFREYLQQAVAQQILPAPVPLAGGGRVDVAVSPVETNYHATLGQVVEYMPQFQIVFAAGFYRVQHPVEPFAKLPNLISRGNSQAQVMPARFYSGGESQYPFNSGRQPVADKYREERTEQDCEQNINRPVPGDPAQAFFHIFPVMDDAGPAQALARIAQYRRRDVHVAGVGPQHLHHRLRPDKCDDRIILRIFPDEGFVGMGQYPAFSIQHHYAPDYVIMLFLTEHFREPGDVAGPNKGLTIGGESAGKHYNMFKTLFLQELALPGDQVENEYRHKHNVNQCHAQDELRPYPPRPQGFSQLQGGQDVKFHIPLIPLRPFCPSS